MYKCYHNKIVQGTDSFHVSQIIGENLLFLSTWILAGYLLWPVWSPSGIPALTIFWILLVVIVQVLLKKHNCSGCYYYDKRCHLGWGKISSALFKQDSGNLKAGLRFSLFYIVTPPAVLVTSVIFGITQHPSWIYWLMLVIFVFLNVISFPVRKSGCSACTMRETCSGSAVKGKQYK
ncbi:MAG: hypothetical protein KJ607_10770 [Bacteroidetes bacterium]|nr:hypothetical protein [Bacteroidota bacterium]